MGRPAQVTKFLMTRLAALLGLGALLMGLIVYGRHATSRTRSNALWASYVPHALLLACRVAATFTAFDLLDQLHRLYRHGSAGR
jgi:hypothetical protein